MFPKIQFSLMSLPLAPHLYCISASQTAWLVVSGLVVPRLVASESVVSDLSYEQEFPLVEEKWAGEGVWTQEAWVPGHQEFCVTLHQMPREQHVVVSPRSNSCSAVWICPRTVIPLPSWACIWLHHLDHAPWGRTVGIGEHRWVVLISGCIAQAGVVKAAHPSVHTSAKFHDQHFASW